MKMYSNEDIENIVEDFLAEYLNLAYVEINKGSLVTLRKICSGYGTEVENIAENKD